jgi:hypothetical protein
MATKIIISCASGFLWKKKCMKVPIFEGEIIFG